jgi:hypothetical protein
MKKIKFFRQRNVTGSHWFWFLAVMGLVTRLPLLRFPTAETTDGVLCLTYFAPDLVATPRFVLFPGYPVLLWLGQGLGLPDWFWGRLLAALAGLLFLIPLWKFSKRWVSEEMAGIICLMALFSPLLWYWSFKVMPDTFFLLLFWWCLERLTTVFLDRKEGAWFQACGLGVLAACVRPEGFLLLPWIWVLSGRSLPEKKWQKRAMTVLFWALPAFLLRPKFEILLSAYREGIGLDPTAGGMTQPFVNFIDHFYAYLSQPLYVFTPLVFWFAILGVAKMVRRKAPEAEVLRKIILQVYLLMFLSRLIPTQYQDRHMLPFLPLVLVAAGFHLEIFFKSLDVKNHPVRVLFMKNGLLTFCLGWSILFSATVLMAQFDSFGDIKRSAEFLKTLPPNAVIYSDEVPKTQYWSGRKVRLLPYLTENRSFDPQPGEYAVLHSFYTPRIGFVDRNMREKHGAVVIRVNDSMVVPLLTDTMADPALQNRTTATAFRFQPQFFKSYVYRIEEKPRKR